MSLGRKLQYCKNLVESTEKFQQSFLGGDNCGGNDQNASEGKYTQQIFLSVVQHRLGIQTALGTISDIQSSGDLRQITSPLWLLCPTGKKESLSPSSPDSTASDEIMCIKGFCKIEQILVTVLFQNQINKTRTKTLRSYNIWTFRDAEKRTGYI